MKKTVSSIAAASMAVAPVAHSIKPDIQITQNSAEFGYGENGNSVKVGVEESGNLGTIYSVELATVGEKTGALIRFEKGSEIESVFLTGMWNGESLSMKATIGKMKKEMQGKDISQTSIGLEIQAKVTSQTKLGLYGATTDTKDAIFSVVTTVDEVEQKQETGTLYTTTKTTTTKGFNGIGKDAVGFSGEIIITPRAKITANAGYTSMGDEKGREFGANYTQVSPNKKTKFELDYEYSKTNNIFQTVTGKISHVLDKNWEIGAFFGQRKTPSTKRDNFGGISLNYNWDGSNSSYSDFSQSSVAQNLKQPIRGMKEASRTLYGKTYTDVTTDVTTNFVPYAIENTEAILKAKLGEVTANSIEVIVEAKDDDGIQKVQLLDIASGKVLKEVSIGAKNGTVKTLSESIIANGLTPDTKYNLQVKLISNNPEKTKAENTFEDISATTKKETVVVNEAPVALDAAFASTDGKTVVGSLADTLSDKETVDAELIIEIVEGPLKGELTSDGTEFVYNIDLTKQISEGESDFFVYRVTDAGGKTDTAKVTLTGLKNVLNTAPSDITFTEPVALSTITPTGTTVTTLSCIDDNSETCTYRITTPDVPFSIVGNTIVTQGQLEAKTYPIAVEAKDESGKTYLEDITFTSVDKNDTAPTISIEKTERTENSITLNISGNDVDGDKAFKLYMNGELVKDFGDELGTDTFTQEGLKDDTTYSFTFEYLGFNKATSKFELQSRTLSATTEKANEAPSNILISNTTVKENLEAGTVVGTLSCVDADSDNNCTYIVSGGPFSVNAQNQLVTTQSLDHEAKSTHNITVVASDGEGTKTKSFTITVLNQLELPKIPTVTVKIINENTVILTASGDARTTGYTFTIDGVGTSTTLGDTYTVTNLVKGPYNYLVVANGVEGSSQAATGSFEVNKDTAPTTPTFTGSTNGTVGENMTIQLSSTDVDGDAITYKIVSGALPAGLTLNGDTISGPPTAEGPYSAELVAEANDKTSSPVTISGNIEAIKTPTWLTIPNRLEGDGLGKNFTVDFSTYIENASGGTFSATNLPTGLTIDSNTGIVSGYFDSYSRIDYWTGFSNKFENVIISYTKDGVTYTSQPFIWEIADEG